MGNDLGYRHFIPDRKGVCKIIVKQVNHCHDRRSGDVSPREYSVQINQQPERKFFCLQFHIDDTFAASVDKVSGLRDL